MCEQFAIDLVNSAHRSTKCLVYESYRNITFKWMLWGRRPTIRAPRIFRAQASGALKF